MRTVRAILLSALVFLPTMTLAQQAGPAAGVTTTASPVAASTTRPITLDVLVTDKAGKLVPGLEPWDFTVLDNNQPRKVLAFRRTDGIQGNKIDPPVEVIVVLDAVNMPYQAVTLLRLQLQKFLRSKGGKLEQPTSIFVFTSEGLKVQPAPSRDGNALAAALDQAGTVRSRGSAAGDYGLAEQFTNSIETLKGIAQNEAHKSGRKILVWLGSGWPLLVDRHFIKTNEGEARHFRNIIEVSRELREARITVYAIWTLNASDTQLLYQAFLKPVQDFHKADAGNLSLQVLATQTGGRILGPSNDIAGQIEACISDIGVYYTVTFSATTPTHADEYHELRVSASSPGSSVRTSSGYYGQP